jgi:putative PIN family toxin of toxin-antitoxin system
VKVVLDTNVLVSGIFFSGPPAEILKAWRTSSIQLALTSEIIDEYLRVGMILAEKFSSIDIIPILNLIVTHSEIVQSQPLSQQVCDDPDDDKFLACALSSDSKIIISGDRHLLKVSGYKGIDIIPPRAFIERFLEKQS